MMWYLPSEEIGIGKKSALQTSDVFDEVTETIASSLLKLQILT